MIEFKNYIEEVLQKGAITKGKYPKIFIPGNSDNFIVCKMDVDTCKLQIQVHIFDEYNNGKYRVIKNDTSYGIDEFEDIEEVFDDIDKDYIVMDILSKYLGYLQCTGLISVEDFDKQGELSTDDFMVFRLEPMNRASDDRYFSVQLK